MLLMTAIGPLMLLLVPLRTVLLMWLLILAAGGFPVDYGFGQYTGVLEQSMMVGENRLLLLLLILVLLLALEDAWVLLVCHHPLLTTLRGMNS